MNFEEYRKARRKLMGKQDTNLECDNIIWASNSLCGEVGELANEVKKLYRDDDQILSDVRLDKIISEGGDILWYLIFFFENILEIPLEHVMGSNIEKLTKRYLKAKDIEEFWKVSNKSDTVYEYKKVKPIEKGEDWNPNPKNQFDIVENTVTLKNKINELCIEQNHVMKDFELYKKAFKQNHSEQVKINFEILQITKHLIIIIDDIVRRIK